MGLKYFIELGVLLLELSEVVARLRSADLSVEFSRDESKVGQEVPVLYMQPGEDRLGEYVVLLGAVVLRADLLVESNNPAVLEMPGRPQSEEAEDGIFDGGAGVDHQGFKVLLCQRHGIVRRHGFSLHGRIEIIDSIAPHKRERGSAVPLGERGLPKPLLHEGCLLRRQRSGARFYKQVRHHRDHGRVRHELVDPHAEVGSEKIDGELYGVLDFVPDRRDFFVLELELYGSRALPFNEERNELRDNLFVDLPKPFLLKRFIQAPDLFFQVEVRAPRAGDDQIEKSKAFPALVDALEDFHGIAKVHLAHLHDG